MARIRSIKPEFFLHEELAELSTAHRLLFIGLWTLADREGRLEDRPRRLKAALYPYEDYDVEQMLADLAGHRQRFIVRYEVNGVRCIAIPGFVEHQKPHVKEPASVIPAPPVSARFFPGKPGPDPVQPETGRVEVEALAGREGKEVEVEPARANPGTVDQPPPPASQVLEEHRPAAAPAAPPPAEPVPPMILKLAQVARETIIPRGAAPPVPDAGEVAAWRQLLAREPEDTWEGWWLPRLCELMRMIRQSEKHGPGGSFVIASPAELLRLANRKEPGSKLILDEMLAKFPTKLETPDKRARKARAAWVTDRANELATAEMARRGSTRWSGKDEQSVKEQAEIEWEQRQGAKEGVAA